MTLDVLALSSDVRAMSIMLRDNLRQFPDRVELARQLLREQAADWEFWQQAVEEETAHSPFLLAKPLEPMDLSHDLPLCPEAYTVAASDGSQIDVDYHGNAVCYIVNVGTVVIQYGPQPAFRAGSRPTLGYLPHELTIQDPKTGREYAVEGAVLAAERDLREGLALAEVALSLPEELPRLAIQDGTLIRWSLQGLDSFLQNRFLGDYLSYLETMHALPCPVVSYMSQPRSPEVTGLVRLLHVRGDVRSWRQRYPQRIDDPFYGIVDHQFFADTLMEGQRSALFASQSQINVNFYGVHLIHFFYLKIGREVARVEFPAWVAEGGQLDLVHALVYDQARRGMGYPTVVQRAHEQAVIHDDDRRYLQTLIERLLVQADIPLQTTAKAASKLHPRV
ncbi:MAG: DNA double-strand break repair nuclease NurA [Herpetosiphonaceae bacterium]|nr:DNA double-strand break repair nuclease NurA [Herpetosiphonaceae bacterium]